MTSIDTSLRVTGLASGMNTDEIVANLVKAQSARLNKLQQSKITSTWKQDAYRDVNKSVDDFLKSMESLRLQSTFNKQTASSSNESVVSATVSKTPTQSSYEITNVQQAKPALASSVKFFGDGFDTTKKLSELGVTGDADGKTSLMINDVNYEFNINDTLDSVLNDITSNTPLTVSYSASEKSFTFTNDSAGENKDVKLGEGTSNLLTTLGITAGSVTSTGSDKYANDSKTSVVVGTDASQAKMWINGMEFRSDTNSITYDGITFDLKANMSSGSLNITTKSDTDAIFSSIKTFVDKYNEVIKDFNGRITEKKYRDYPPLLDDQKTDMKDNDIKLWDEKAKSGLLSSDSTISTFLTEMRNSLTSAVENSGAFKTLKEIGIDFSSSYQDNGKLVLDEEKLKGVLQSNLEDVKKLFTDKGTSTNSSATTATDKDMFNQSGFGWRIYDRINVTTKQLTSLAGSPGATVDTNSFMAKQITSLTTNIDKEQDRIDSYEERLWKQFGAMEKALQQMNSQSSWLTQQLG
ncbi:flagellar filament capping protein FliD [Neobacillus jeddahensis]|uniref:flagellar filament capping protein FliD n=1 Tax=Neobacillus jeddahensis TaxID=1461580 RepID=UPI0005902970|nr:flagellar filament capping protein FliD [Neobacillus jeddahensis]